MKTYPPGHYAIRRTYGHSYISAPILAHTAATVKVQIEAFGPATWRKMEVLAVVPPDRIDAVMARLEMAIDEKDQKERTAKVQHQIEVQNILKGYEV